MKCVFTASNGVEAHMVLNLLEQEGIEGRVEGEYLQGGVGDLQAMNFVRVLVADQDFSEAKEIIAEWEAKQPEPKDTPQEQKSGRGFGAFLIGLVIGVLGMYWAYSTPVTTDGIDYSGNGALDVEWTYKNRRLSKAEMDRNFDGEVDSFDQYSRRGMIEYSKLDENFDGVFETKVTYRNGNPWHLESDRDNDGRIDYEAHYVHGVLSEAVIAGKNANAPVKRQHFEMGKLVKAEFDSDGDGEFETEYTYDWFEEPIKVE